MSSRRAAAPAAQAQEEQEASAAQAGAANNGTSGVLSVTRDQLQALLNQAVATVAAQWPPQAAEKPEPLMPAHVLAAAAPKPGAAAQATMVDTIGNALDNAIAAFPSTTESATPEALAKAMEELQKGAWQLGGWRGASQLSV